MKTLSVFILCSLLVSIPASYGAEVFRSPIPNERKQIPVIPRKEAPNRIISKKVNYSGAVVMIYKHGILYALNPAAPRSAGQGYENLSRDPTTGEGDGLALFTIEF